jgi:hypothetical protein
MPKPQVAVQVEPAPDLRSRQQRRADERAQAEFRKKELQPVTRAEVRAALQDAKGQFRQAASILAQEAATLKAALDGAKAEIGHVQVALLCLERVLIEKGLVTRDDFDRHLDGVLTELRQAAETPPEPAPAPQA